MTWEQLLKLKRGDLIRLRGKIFYYAKLRDSGMSRVDNDLERFCIVIGTSPHSIAATTAQTSTLSATRNANCELFFNNTVVNMLVNPAWVDLIET